MPGREIESGAGLGHHVGPEVAVSDWLEVSQPLQGEFAAGSGVKPPRAKAVTGHRTPKKRHALNKP